MRLVLLSGISICFQVLSQSLGQVTHVLLTIQTLTKALLGYHPEQLPRNLADLAGKQIPFMNLMMD